MTSFKFSGFYVFLLRFYVITLVISSSENRSSLDCILKRLRAGRFRVRNPVGARDLYLKRTDWLWSV